MLKIVGPAFVVKRPGGRGDKQRAVRPACSRASRKALRPEVEFSCVWGMTRCRPRGWVNLLGLIPVGKSLGWRPRRVQGVWKVQRALRHCSQGEGRLVFTVVGWWCPWLSRPWGKKQLGHSWAEKRAPRCPRSGHWGPPVWAVLFLGSGCGRALG